MTIANDLIREMDRHQAILLGYIARERRMDGANYQPHKRYGYRWRVCAGLFAA